MLTARVVLSVLETGDGWRGRIMSGSSEAWRCAHVHALASEAMRCAHASLLAGRIYAGARPDLRAAWQEAPAVLAALEAAGAALRGRRPDLG